MGWPGGPEMTAQPLGLTSEHRVSLLSANSSSDQRGRCALQAQLNYLLTCHHLSIVVSTFNEKEL